MFKRLLLLWLIMGLPLFLMAQRYEQEPGPLKTIITQGSYSVYEKKFASLNQAWIRRFNLNIDPTPDAPFSGDEYKYIFRSTKVTGKVIYGIKDWWQVELSTDYMDINTIDDSTNFGETLKDSGFTNPTIKFRHVFYSKDSYSDLGITYGVKFGDSSRRDNISYLNVGGNKVAPFQYGGNDYMFGFHFTSVLEKGLISGDINYVWTGDFTNKDGEMEDPGNYLEYNIGYVYPASRIFRITLELNAARHYTTRINDVKQAFTDYDYIFISPGIEVSLGENLLLMGTYMYPLTYKLPLENSNIVQDKELDSWVSFGLYYLY